LRALAAIGYSLSSAALLFGLLAAYAGSQADVGRREQSLFAAQGLAIAASGLIGIGVIRFACRSGR